MKLLVNFNILFLLINFNLMASEIKSSWPFNPIFKGYLKLDQILEKHQNKEDISIAIIDSSYKNLRSQNSQKNKTYHKEHIKGIIKQVNPKAKISLLPLYSKEKNTYLKSLEKAVYSNNKIINISAGGFDTKDSFSYKKELELLKIALKKNKLVIVASGNNGKELKNYYPASHKLENMIVVGSHKESLVKNESSNYGDKVDIFAPGTNILAKVDSNKIYRMSGTSQAVPFVSGFASILWSNFPNLSHKEVKEIILKGSTNIENYQILNPAKSYELAQNK